MQGDNTEEQELAAVVLSIWQRSSYVVTTSVILRGTSLILLVAFGILARQALPLLGKNGVLPVRLFLDWYGRGLGSVWDAFWAHPSVFWFESGDPALLAFALVGILLSVLGVLGRANLFSLLVLWALYLSYVHVGQTFYSYGWEYLLLEATSLCVLVAPLGKTKVTDPRVLVVGMWLFRWLLFRLMFGSGLIKLTGDPCWRDLSCLVYHYETQPNPGPLSWLFFQLPGWVQQAGVLLNHFVELFVPFFYFGPRSARLLAGVITVVFQLLLILSGNLSFFNWLTIVIACACFDDQALLWCRARIFRRQKQEGSHDSQKRSRPRFVAIALYALLVGGLSLDPVANFLAIRPKMNATYNRLHLVNSYGAFGSVNKARYEIIIEGTRDVDPENAHFVPYEFPCKPGALDRAPCLVTPYHHRLGWQMWFASFGTPDTEPWLVRLGYLLLRGEESVFPLLEKNPFSEAPPRYIKMTLYRYEFTGLGDDAYWKRTLVGPWIRPVSVNDPELLAFLKAHGLLDEQP